MKVCVRKRISLLLLSAQCDVGKCTVHTPERQGNNLSLTSTRISQLHELALKS